MSKIGRPTKFNASTRRTILRLVKRGVPFCHACAVVRISRQTFANWRAQDERFREQLDEAVANGVASRLAVIERGLKSKDESIRIRCAQWALEHTPGSAEHFARNRVEVTGENGSPIAPPVTAPIVQFVFPDNQHDSNHHIGSGHAERKAIGAG